MQDYFTPGRLVSSTAGRDSGKYYLILERVNETRVRVVNGTDRKVSGPKLKNTRHLKVYPLVAGEIAHKVSTGQRVTDLDVRRALQELLAHYGQATPADNKPSDGKLEQS